MFGTLVAATDDDFLVVVQVVACDSLDFLAHGSREEQGVAVGGNAFEDLVDAFRESHVEHLVGLVEHHVAHLVEMGHATVHQVDETSGGGDDDLHTFFERIDLVDDRCAAIDWNDAHAPHVFGEILQVITDL